MHFRETLNCLFSYSVRIGLCFFLTTLFLTNLTCSKAMAETQEPSFSVEEKDGDFEIRLYDPLLVAEVITKGDRSSAITSGFRLLADFIFGNNQTPNQKFTNSRQSPNKGEKISMTVPVTQQPIIEQSEGSTWKVRFMMPKAYTLSTLPIPNNDSVKIRAEAAKRYATVRFTGWSSESNLNEHKQILEKWIAKKNLRPVGLPIYAFYNPPWSLPFLRRNECLIEIEQ